jgi:hypothetical protein
MLCHVAIVRTDISEEPIASIIRVTRNGKQHSSLLVLFWHPDITV